MFLHGSAHTVSGKSDLQTLHHATDRACQHAQWSSVALMLKKDKAGLLSNVPHSSPPKQVTTKTEVSQAVASEKIKVWL